MVGLNLTWKDGEGQESAWNGTLGVKVEILTPHGHVSAHQA